MRVFDQDTVVRVETRERGVSGRKGHRLLESGTIPVECQVANGYAPATPSGQNGRPMEITRRAEGGPVSRNDQIARIGRDIESGMNFNLTWREADRAGACLEEQPHLL